MNRGCSTYPEYFTVLIIAVLSGIVLPGDSELVLAHVAQARVLASLHLLYEPAGKLRLGRAERKHDRSAFCLNRTSQQEKRERDKRK